MEMNTASLAEPGEAIGKSSLMEEALMLKQKYSRTEELDRREKALSEREKKLKANLLGMEKEVAELDNWAKELDMRESQVQKLEEEMNSFKSREDKWEEDRTAILEGFKRAEAELLERDQELEDRARKLDEVEEQILNAMKVAENVSVRSEEIRDFQRRLEAKDAKMASLSKELEDKEKLLSTREAEVSAREAVIGRYEEAIQLQENEILRLKEELSSITNEFNDLRNRYDRRREEAKQTEALRSALRNVETERDNLRKKVQEPSRARHMEELHKLNERIRGMEEELEKKKFDEKKRIEDLVRLERTAREKEKLLREREEVLKEKDREVEKLKIYHVQTPAKTPEYVEQRDAWGDSASKPSTQKPSGPEEKILQTSSPESQLSNSRSPELQYSPEAERWFQKGKALMKKGNYRPAILCFDHALEETPGDGDVLLLKARALYATNSHVQASRLLDSLSDSLPDDPDVWELKGLNLYKMHHEIEALNSFERVVELEKRPSALKLACRLSQKRGRLTKALEYIDEALRIDPEDGQSWKMKSSVLSGMGQHKESGEALRNSVGRKR